MKNFIKKIVCITPLLLLLYAFSMSTAQKSPRKVIVFDIGGVLLLTDTLKSFQNLGVKEFARYAWQKKSFNSDIIRSKFFKLLSTIKPFEKDITYTVKDDNGLLLPPLMLDWLKGENAAHIKAQVCDYIDKNSAFFTSKQEAVLLKNLTTMVFDPATFAQSRKLNKPIVSILRKLSEKNYTVLLCSNWDPASFELCKSLFPEIFKYIDGYVISGYEKSLKPEQAIFERLMSKYGIDTAQQTCLFVDDQKENRVTAKKYGFIALHPDSLKKVCQNFELL